MTEPQTEPRFAFGKNWQSFLAVLDEDRIAEAEGSLRGFLEVDSLEGKRFLDIGSGSGLFSLAARRLGAAVHSFDYDQDSVRCTRELRERYFPDDPHWTIEQGSVLDRTFVEGLETFDVAYAWGVLHHTGDLWLALENAARTIAPDGLFFVAIYRDQGVRSRTWYWIKRSYCSGPFARRALEAIFFPLFFLAGLVLDLARFRNPRSRYTEHRKRHRGMSLVHDWRDWLGGFPFEPATADQVTEFLARRGFRLRRLQPPEIGFGNNQFLFQRCEAEP
jgi:2-polyprenyl-6-hydroxyphenyl methylase/3-demethylubiquinone-9 3-methyltransferase